MLRSRGKSDLNGPDQKARYNPVPVPRTTLYFAYTAFLDPDRLHAVAPGARFAFTAHFPETKLAFVHSEEVGAVPSLVPDSGHTVWGGVFEIPDDQVSSLTGAEEAEGRVAGWDQKAVDREGNKYDCLTFVAKGSPNGEHRPDSDYLEVDDQRRPSLGPARRLGDGSRGPWRRFFLLLDLDPGCRIGGRYREQPVQAVGDEAPHQREDDVYPEL